MKEESEIPITKEELIFIAKEEIKNIIELVELNSYCRHCHDQYTSEMVSYKIVINHLNDLIFKGHCSLCNNPIARYIELGEQLKFRLKTEIIKSNKFNRN